MFSPFMSSHVASIIVAVRTTIPTPDRLTFYMHIHHVTLKVLFGHKSFVTVLALDFFTDAFICASSMCCFICALTTPHILHGTLTCTFLLWYKRALRDFNYFPQSGHETAIASCLSSVCCVKNVLCSSSLRTAKLCSKIAYIMRPIPNEGSITLGVNFSTWTC